MTKQIGIWIDHKKAVLMTVGVDDETIQIIESGLDRHVHFRGATRPRTPYSAQYQKGEDQLDKQYEGYLNKYYEKVLLRLRGANAVWIIGPGEAKHELKRRIEGQKTALHIVGVEAADKMTDRQFAMKVRQYFEEVGVKA